MGVNNELTAITIEVKGVDGVAVPVVKASLGASGIVENNLIALLDGWINQKIKDGKNNEITVEQKKDFLSALKLLESKTEELTSQLMKMPVAVKAESVVNDSMVDLKAGGKVKVEKTTLEKLDNRKPQSIGFFGVTANPPHVGHCEVIKQALEEYDEVWISPVYKHPFGKKPIPYEHRLEMLELIIEDFFPLEQLRRIRIVEVDKEFFEKNQTMPFSYDLLKYLRDNLPKNEYAFIIGEDNFVPEVWTKFYRHKDIENEFKIFVAKDSEIHSTKIRQNFADLDESALEIFCYPQVTKYLKKYQFYA